MERGRKLRKTGPPWGGLRFVVWMVALVLAVGFLSSDVWAKKGEGLDQDGGTLRLISEGNFPSGDGTRPSVRAGALGAEEAENAANEIYRGILEYETKINVEKYGITKNEVSTFLEEAINERPDLFYVGGSFSYTYGELNGVVVEIRLSYRYEKSEIVKMQKEMAGQVGRLLEGLDPSASEFEKALHVHDALALNCEYDMDYYKYGQNKDYVSSSSFSMKGALLDGVAVCQGYAMAYKYILETYLGMECKTALSEEMDHAWNVVKIGSSYYHLDVTSDDAVPDILGNVSHEFFLLSEQGARAKKYKGFNYVGLAADPQFDDAQWKDVSSAFLKAGDGARYYVDQAGWFGRFSMETVGDGYRLRMEALRNLSELAGSEWNYGKLAQQGDVFYFNTERGVHSMDGPAGMVAPVWNWTGDGKVYGLAWKNGVLQSSVAVGSGSSLSVTNHSLELAKEDVRTRYYVVFDARMGSEKPKAGTAGVGETVALPDAPKNPGYSFAGWYREPNGKGGEFKTDTALSSDEVLYAKWVKSNNFSLKNKSVRLAVGGTYSLNQYLSPQNASVTYRSNNKKVAGVGASGKLKAKAVGTCKVTIASKGDPAIKRTLKVTVTPKKPTGVKAKAGKKGVGVTWKKGKGVSGWEVFRSTRKNKGYRRIAILKGAEKTSYKDAKAKKGKTYYYKLRAYQSVKGKKVYGGFGVVRKVKR